MKPIEIEREELLGLLERTRAALSEEEYGKLKAALETLSYLTSLVADKETTIRQLRQLLLGFSKFPRTTEKTKDVLEETAPDEATAEAPPSGSEAPPEKKSTAAPGHGRNGASDYEAAKKVVVAHPDLKHGAPWGKS